jgi:hypothetical protein
MVLRLKKFLTWPGSSAALHRFIGQILLSVLSGNTCVLPTLLHTDILILKLLCIPALLYFSRTSQLR